MYNSELWSFHCQQKETASIARIQFLSVTLITLFLQPLHAQAVLLILVTKLVYVTQMVYCLMLFLFHAFMHSLAYECEPITIMLSRHWGCNRETIMGHQLPAIWKVQECQTGSHIINQEPWLSTLLQLLAIAVYNSYCYCCYRHCYTRCSPQARNLHGSLSPPNKIGDRGRESLIHDSHESMLPTPQDSCHAAKLQLISISS